VRSSSANRRSSPRPVDRALRVSEPAGHTLPAGPDATSGDGSTGFDRPSHLAAGSEHPSGSSGPSEPAPTLAVTAAQSGPASGKPAPAKAGRKGQRPAMPSWEDVLLGTRSSGL